ncbi:MAG: class I SAM-dependent methyltransferase [Nitrospirota bacterium]
MLNKEQITTLYRKRAKRYNFTANLYYLIGFRESAYRKKAVEALDLHKGSTIVEIGCGAGINFPLFQEAVGMEGKIIGVDLTDAMLEMARLRIEKKNWDNVELVHSDASLFQYPPDINGIISTFAITLIPEFDTVIRNGCRSLREGGRWVILDLKKPSNWLAKLEPLYLFITRPFGVTKDISFRHPWESIEKYMEDTSFHELFWGFSYLSVGIKGSKSC